MRSVRLFTSSLLPCFSSLLLATWVRALSEPGQGFWEPELCVCKGQSTSLSSFRVFYRSTRATTSIWDSELGSKWRVVNKTYSGLALVGLTVEVEERNSLPAVAFTWFKSAWVTVWTSYFHCDFAVTHGVMKERTWFVWIVINDTTQNKTLLHLLHTCMCVHTHTHTQGRYLSLLACSPSRILGT